MKKIILLCTACLLTIACLAQEPTGIFASDTLSITSSNIKKPHQKKSAERNLHYNNLMTFRMNPQDTTMRRSVLPVAMAFMFKGGLNIMVKPQLFFKDDKFRIFGQFSYKNTQENFYGVGYSTNKDYVRSDTTSQYRYSGIQINPWFLFRIGESNFFVGQQID